MFYLVIYRIMYSFLFLTYLTVFINALYTNNKKTWNLLFVILGTSIYTVIMLGLMTLDSMVDGFLVTFSFLFLLIVSAIVRLLKNRKIKNTTKTDIPKFIKRTLIAVIIIYIILIAANIGLNSYDNWLQNKTIQNSEFIIRVEFTGLKNWLHKKYEHYAISPTLVKQVDLEKINKQLNVDFNALKSSSKANNTHYYVELQYSPEYEHHNYGSHLTYFNKCLDTPLGPKYKIFYKGSKKHHQELTAEEEAIIIDIAMRLYSGDLSQWFSRLGDELGLVSFDFIKNNKYNNKYLIDDGSVLYLLENNDLKELMSVPENGSFEYYYFL